VRQPAPRAALPAHQTLGRKPCAALLRRWLPERVDPGDPGHLCIWTQRKTPVIALGAAAREALRLADVLESMLLGLRHASEKGGRRQISNAERLGTCSGS
jgi:phosphate:Na+ symporter